MPRAGFRATGRTTEHTQGFIQALYATVSVKYDLFKKATFVDQIIISQSMAEEDFSNGGDSGSLGSIEYRLTT